MSRAQPRTPSSSDNPNHVWNAARLGAATAFARPALQTKTSARSITSVDGTLVGSDDHTKGKANQLRAPSPLLRNENSQNNRGIRNGEDTSAGSALGLLMLDENDLSQRVRHSKSPSHHAALVAAARAPVSTMANVAPAESRKRAAAVKRPSAPPKPRRLSQQSGLNLGASRDLPTDDTPIPPTTALVNLFERRASASQASSSTTPQPPVQLKVVAPSPDLPLSSPKPVRSSSGVTNRFQLELEKPRDNLAAKPSAPNAMSAERTSWDPNTRSFRPQSEIIGFQRAVTAAAQADGRRSVDEQRSANASPTASLESTETGLSQLQLREPGSIPPSTRLQPRANLAPMYRQVTASPGPLNNNTTDPIKLRNPSPQSVTDAGKHFTTSPSSVAGQYHQLYHKKPTPSIIGDRLVDAMVASSLASSRTNSPRPQNKPEPPPPRISRHKHKLSFSRTPSPAKVGMLQTLRKVESESSESEDDLHPYSKHRKDKHRLVRKHPHKHHEGDRKRWREAVTERERKRYEGVWAANKGLYFSLTREEQQFIRDSPLDPAAMELQLGVQEQVSNLATREIWSRSRLPKATLETIWDLVDSDNVGRLSKEAFVVGLWLIDQRLKGRKLPVKVSDSVWQSVQGLHGIKIHDTRKTTHR